MFTIMILGLIVSTIIQHTTRERFLSHQRVKDMSLTDALTGLKNRLFYQTIIKDEISNYTRIQNHLRDGYGERLSDKIDNSIYAFILLDIDYFKRVNDSYGHEAGDFVLKEISNRILDIVRTDDSLIRWGGEEFLLLMRNTRPEYIEILVERIRNEISRKPFKIGDVWEQITVSGGISILCRHSDNNPNESEELFELADKALYFSKKNGRNRFTQITVEGDISNRTEYFKNISEPDRTEESQY